MENRDSHSMHTINLLEIQAPKSEDEEKAIDEIDLK